VSQHGKDQLWSAAGAEPADAEPTVTLPAHASAERSSDEIDFEPPSRLCPHCATISHTAGPFCPQCGGQFSGSRRGRVSTRVKFAAAGVAALLVLGGAGVAVAIKHHHDSEVAAQHRRAVAAARARAEAQARAQAVAKARVAARQAKLAAEKTDRQALESQLETAITSDATRKANQGLLTSGPAHTTNCTPVSGGSSESLNQASGTYSCIAEYQTNSDGTSSGYNYTGTIDFANGSMTWQLGSGA
jgi:hypothetical protein